MMNAQVLEAPTRQPPGEPAGMLETAPSGAVIANVSNPFYALAAFLLLSVLPYLVPLEYMEIIRVVGPGEHLAVSLALGLLLFGLYALYALLFAPRSVTGGGPGAVPYDPHFLEVMHGMVRLLMWLGIAANAAVLAYCLKEIGGGVFAMKRALGDLGGVNILTQSYLLAVGPWIALGLRLNRPWRLELVLLAAILLGRALLMAERLAVLEFAVPTLVVLVLLRRIRVLVTRLLLIAVGVPVLFVVGEIFRSFYAKFVMTDGWSQMDLDFILQWNLERLALYYTDTMNKFYFQIKFQFFHTTDFWLNGIQNIASRFGLAERYGGAQLNTLVSVFDFGNEEMNNPGGMAILLSDFGWYGIAVFLLFLLALFAAHWRACRGGLLALAFYPVLFMTWVEMPRFIYPYLSRTLFPILLFLGAYMAVRLFTSPAPPATVLQRAPQPRGG